MPGEKEYYRSGGKTNNKYIYEYRVLNERVC